MTILKRTIAYVLLVTAMYLMADAVAHDRDDAWLGVGIGACVLVLVTILIPDDKP